MSQTLGGAGGWGWGGRRRAAAGLTREHERPYAAEEAGQEGVEGKGTDEEGVHKLNARGGQRAETEEVEHLQSEGGDRR